jgi:uncharacterized protein
MDNLYRITSEQEIEAVLGEPMEFVKVKIQSQLDEVMQEFIRRAPLIFVATIDASGHVDVSPKGDPAGFVQIDNDGNLLIPERPGNKLTFGFRNILRNSEIGLIFVVPNQRETLRVKGVATLHKDPDIVNQMQVNGQPALMFTRVDVKECFFHCGKALIRSRLWKPEFWDTTTESLGAKSFASLWGKPSDDAVRATEKRLDEAYRDELY